MRHKQKSLLILIVSAAVMDAALYLLREQQYILTLLNFVCMYMISISGLDIMFGYSGQISLGHAAFCASGAYTTALPHGISGIVDFSRSKITRRKEGTQC